MVEQTTINQLAEILTGAELVDVITMQAIFHAVRPVNEDLTVKDNFSRRVIAAFNELPWNEPRNGSLALARLLACEDFEERKSLEGLGGCIAVPLKHLLDEVNEQLSSEVLV